MSSPNVFQLSQHSLLKTVVLSPLLLFSLFSPMDAIAQVPSQAVINKIRGRKELWVRRRGRPTPAQIGSTLEKYNDSLLVNGNSSTFATLKFFSQASQDLNLFVQTEIHPDSAIYFFPCQFQGGSHLFGWGLASKLSKGCTRGMKIQSGRPTTAFPPTFSDPISINASFSLVAQSFPVLTHYCSINDGHGHSWMAMSRGNPCSEILASCLGEQNGNTCTIETIGQWWSHEEQITAAVECEQNKIFKIEGSGTELNNQAQSLWNDAIAQQSKACALQVYRPHDLIVAPPSSATTASAGHNPFLPETIDPGILIRSQTTETCPEIKVLDGAALVKSAQNPQGILVQFGNKATTNYCEQAEVVPIDLKKESQTLSVEILSANIQGLPFCDELQVSGGQQGDRRTIQLTATTGILNIEYDMKPVPDQMQIFYEGKELYNSSLVSNKHELQLPFSGKSGQIEIVITGNPEVDTTLWDYKIECPS